MRILILGGDGMLGHKVYQVLCEHFDVFVTFRRSDGVRPRYPIYTNTHPEQLIYGSDAMNFDSIIQAFAHARPDVVINCIGVVSN